MGNELAEEDYKKKYYDSEDKFDTIFRLTTAASKVINSDLIILRVNKAMCDLLGYSEEEIVGTRILDYACEEHKDHWHSLQLALWETKMPFFNLEACLISKSKSLVWIKVTSILFNDNGETYGFTVLDNITDTKKLKESEKKLQLALEQANKGWENFRKLVDQAPVAIATFEGTDYKISIANELVLKYWGKTAEEIIDKPLFTALPEARQQGYEELLKSVLHSGKRVYANELPVTLIRNGNLETTYVNFIYDPMRDASGCITGVIVVSNEVTEQVQARRKIELILVEKSKVEWDLRANERRLRDILETMAEGVGITDANGNMVYVNQTAQRILGIEEDEVLMRTYFDTKWKNLRVDGSPLHPDEHPVSISLKTGQQVFDHEIAVQKPDGERIYVSINSAPLKDEEGNIIGGIGTFMDVSGRRKSIQLKDEFISTVSHELKTPVTTIKAYTQILERSSPRTLNQSFLQRMEIQVLRLEQLIEDLLDVGRVDSGTLALKPEHILANELLTEVVNDIKLITPAHQLIVSELEDLAVETDKSRLIQVITNVVNNAIKFSEKGKDVYISLKRAGKFAIFSVQDSGVGIADSQKPFVFDKFHHIDMGGASVGLGLGLFICKEIIDKAGGQLWFESEEGKGSTFFFSVPCCL